ncbi:MAG: DUF1761 domain-containing protein, partial [Candidatus Doudnabacteria bacterium]|nr:DUF1761 domain-containing protein [Candidatus Doudnabacteria bacterium]
SAIATMITGMLWYGPLLGKTWAREMGWGTLTPEQSAEMKKKANKAYPQQLIGAFLMAYVFAHILQAFDSNSIAMALEGAFWVWLGLIVPVKYGDVLWNNKSIKLFFIDSVYYLVNLAVFAIILSLWS